MGAIPERAAGNPVSQLGFVRPHIPHRAAMAAIHGERMAGELTRHGYQVPPHALYPVVYRMQDEGRLASRQEVVDGRAGRVDDITDLGWPTLAEQHAALTELATENFSHQEQQ